MRLWRRPAAQAEPSFIAWTLDDGQNALLTATREPAGRVQVTLVDIFGSRKALFDSGEVPDGDCS